MDVLYWILFGAVLGILATLFSGEVSMDEFLSTSLLGVLGALLGGLVGNLLFRGEVGKFSIFSYFVAVMVAFTLVVIDKRFNGKKT